MGKGWVFFSSLEVAGGHREHVRLFNAFRYREIQSVFLYTSGVRACTLFKRYRIIYEVCTSRVDLTNMLTPEVVADIFPQGVGRIIIVEDINRCAPPL